MIQVGCLKENTTITIGRLGLKCPEQVRCFSENTTITIGRLGLMCPEQACRHVENTITIHSPSWPNMFTRIVVIIR
jgi:hypothetical protein